MITDKSFLELHKPPTEEKDEFVAMNLMYVFVKGSPQDLMPADDFISMLNTWYIGQAEEAYSIDADELNAWLKETDRIC